MPDTRQASLFDARLHLTRPLLKKRRRAELERRVRRSLLYFPELSGQRITIGVTRTADGVAVLEDMTVRFRVGRQVPSYYTVGHELTHLLQALRRVPNGEVQCDIWTLARARLFTDEPPCYLPLPAPVRRQWRRYAARVRWLCGRAIVERGTRHAYIRWLCDELERLS